VFVIKALLTGRGTELWIWRELISFANRKGAMSLRPFGTPERLNRLATALQGHCKARFERWTRQNDSNIQRMYAGTQSACLQLDQKTRHFFSPVLDSISQRRSPPRKAFSLLPRSIPSGN
jgi:hypothetical protein